MAKIDFISEDDLKQSDIPDGIHPAIVEKCEIQPQKANPNARKVFWQFMIDGDSDSTINGNRVFLHTSVEKGRGGQFMKMLEGLGVPFREFDDEAMVGTKVLLETKTKVRDNRTQVDVVEIRRG